MGRGKFVENPPRADALVESLRAFGYEVNEALCDIIDNSVAAAATEVQVLVDGAENEPVLIIRDNGHGMLPPKLVEAMRLGAQSPLEERLKGDLGRYSLGLKTASFSQAEGLCVVTKPAGGEVAAAFWELPTIRKEGKWLMGQGVPKCAASEAERLAKETQGTTVIWYLIDRIHERDTEGGTLRVSRLGLEQALEESKLHINMTFHRFLQRTGPKKLRIRVGSEELKGWDPLMQKHKVTSQRLDEPHQVHGHPVRIKGFILPHKSRMTEQEFRDAAGTKGWNAHQGFYLYRADRLIVSGTWFGFMKQDEHCKLARIAIDIPTTLDKEWHVDVRKASVVPPKSLRKDLRRIATSMRTQAQEMYSGRINKRRRVESQPSDLVWLEQPTRERGITYKVNRKHAAIEQLLAGSKEKPQLERLIHIIEKGLPFRSIEFHVNDQRGEALTHAATDGEVRELMKLADELVFTRTKTLGLARKAAITSVMEMEPFCNLPQLQVYLQELLE